MEVEQTLARIAMGRGTQPRRFIWIPSRAMCPAAGSMSGSQLAFITTLMPGAGLVSQGDAAG